MTIPGAASTARPARRPRDGGHVRPQSRGRAAAAPRLHLNRRSRAREPSPTSPSAAHALDESADRAARPLNDIHAELGNRLEAYGVFTPRPDHAFELFQVVYIHGSDKPRHQSPQSTAVNLKTMCETMLENVDDPDEDCSLSEVALNKILKQMDDDKIKRNTSDEGPVYTAVTESSLETAMSAGGSVQAAELFSAGANVSHSAVASRRIAVAIRESEWCTRVIELRKQIWKNGEALFNQILVDLDTDLNMARDERRLIAVVTKRIKADIHVSRERGFSHAYSAEAGIPNASINAVFDRSRFERDESHQEGGIAGIQYILFPMQRTGDYKFRFLPGISVLKVDDDDPDGTSTDPFSVYKRWQQRYDHPDDGPYDRQCDIHFNNYGMACTADCLQRARSAPTPESEGIPNGGMFRHMGSQDDVPDPYWIDVVPRINRSPFIDVDLNPRFTDFAMRQCMLAARYQAEADYEARRDQRNEEAGSGQRAKSVELLRSALRKCCYDSTLRALSDLAACYHSGRGVSQELDTASILRYCGRLLEHIYESRRIWTQCLSENRSFFREPQPERRIIQWIGTSGPRPRFRLCLASNVVDAILTTRALMHLCASRGYWYMLLPEKLSFSTAPESITHLLTMAGAKLISIRVKSAGDSVEALVSASVAFGSLYPTAPSQQTRLLLLDDKEPPKSIVPEMETGLSTSSFGGMLPEVMFEYLCRKLLGLHFLKSSKKKQTGAAMQLIHSVVNAFGKTLNVQDYVRSGAWGAAGGRKRASTTRRPAIPGTGKRQSMFTVSYWRAKGSFPKITVCFTQPEKTLRHTLESEHSLAMIPMFFIPKGPNLNTAFGSPPRRSHAEPQPKKRHSAPTLKSGGIPYTRDRRQAQSMSMSYGEAFEVPSFGDDLPDLPGSLHFPRK